jgi:collagenase-like PrtC family protease
VRWEQTPAAWRRASTASSSTASPRASATGYPTLCKGRFEVNDETYYAIEEPTSLNTLELLPKLMEVGVKAIKIEGRQRSPAYVAQVTKVWREAIDKLGAAQPPELQVREAWMAELNKVSEGNSIRSGPTIVRGSEMKLATLERSQ